MYCKIQCHPWPLPTNGQEHSIPPVCNQKGTAEDRIAPGWEPHCSRDTFLLRQKKVKKILKMENIELLFLLFKYIDITCVVLKKVHL